MMSQANRSGQQRYAKKSSLPLVPSSLTERAMLFMSIAYKDEGFCSSFVCLTRKIAAICSLMMLSMQGAQLSQFVQRDLMY